MPLMRTAVRRLTQRHGARTYTLREAVAIAEAQGVLTPSPSAAGPGPLAPAGFEAAPFIGCDPLRGAFQDILTHPLLGAEARAARPSGHSSPARVRVHGVILRVEAVTQQAPSTEPETMDAAAPSAQYSVSLLLEVPHLATLAEAATTSVDAADGPATVMLRGQVSASTLPREPSDATGKPSDDAPTESHVLDILRSHLESKRVQVSGALRLTPKGCYVAVHEADLLSALHFTPS